MENIKSCYRRARKPHVCNFCNGEIRPGTRYCYEFNKQGGEVWNFYSHLECQFVAQELWHFIDPYDGMEDTDFQDGVREFCQHMICPGCDQFDPVYRECTEDKSYCISKCVEVLKQYDFISAPELGPLKCYWIWRLVKKSEPVTLLPGE